MKETTSIHPSPSTFGEAPIPLRWTTRSCVEGTHMLSHRLLICGATLACATTTLIGPATHASAEPAASSIASTCHMSASGATSTRSVISSLHPQVSGTSSTTAPARRTTSTSSESGATALAVLIMIGVFFVILLPACIIQAIVYRRARKNIHDMPNYTSANGPQYGVTGYPQGTEPPGRSWYTGFSPPWSYKHPCTGRHTRVFPRERVRYQPGTGTGLRHARGSRSGIRHRARPGTDLWLRHATPRRNLAGTEQPGLLTRTWVCPAPMGAGHTHIHLRVLLIRRGAPGPHRRRREQPRTHPRYRDPWNQRSRRRVPRP